MCGICGIIAEPREEYQSRIYNLMTQLLLETEVRGKHATGWASMDYDGRLGFHKEPVSANEFVAGDNWVGLSYLSLPPFFVGHCRYATNGNPKENKNNHPFVSTDGSLALVHNGVIRGHKRLAEAENIKLKTNCDSEIVLRVIEKAKDSAEGIRNTFDKVFLATHRDGACALIDTKQNSVYLFRNTMRPLNMIRIPELGNALVFASTPTIIENAVRTTLNGIVDFKETFQLKSGRIYKVTMKRNMEPEIETEDVPVKVYRDNDFFSTKLQPPSARTTFRVSDFRTQGELFPVGFDDTPEYAPEEVVCLCGYVSYLWKGETRRCNGCNNYDLSPGMRLQYVGVENANKWVRLYCNKCNTRWEQKFVKGARCIRCDSNQVGTSEESTSINKINKETIWKCRACNAKISKVKVPDYCPNCLRLGKSVSFELQDSSNFQEKKRCHDCGKRIPQNGPSRCHECVIRRSINRKRNRRLKSDSQKENGIK